MIYQKQLSDNGYLHVVMVVIFALNKCHLDMVSYKPVLSLKAPVNTWQLGSSCSWTAREGHSIGSP